MDSKFKMYEWKKYKDYYREENGEIIWNDNAPNAALESYRLYSSQIQKLNEFPTERKTGLFSMFEKSKEKTVQNVQVSLVDKATSFLISYNQGVEINTRLTSSNFIYIDSSKEVYTNVLDIPSRDMNGFKIIETFKKHDRVIVMWNVSRLDFISVFYFDENQKISRMQEYICGK